MLHPKKLDELTQKLLSVIPQGVKDIPHDIEKNFQVIIQSAFSKMDLVTREEFDTQVALLYSTREKLDALEQTITTMETQKAKK